MRRPSTRTSWCSETLLLSERESFRQSLGHGLGSFAAVAILGLVTSVVLARIYGNFVIGQFALVVAPVVAVQYLSTAQEQAALIRELTLLPARAPRITGLFTAVFAFSFTLSAVVGAIAVGIVALLYGGPFDHPNLVWPVVVQMAGYILVTNTCWNVDSVLSSFRQGRSLFWIRLAQALVFFALAVALGHAWGTVWGLIVATIGSWATGLAHRVWALRRIMSFRVPHTEIRAGFATLPGLVRFGIRAAPGTLVGGVAAESGTWILGATASLGSIGAWDRARQLGVRLREGTIRLNEVLLPTLVERREDDREGHDRALVDSARYAGAGLLLFAAAGGGAAKGVMEVFGEGFVEGADALAFLLVLEALVAVAAVLVSALYAADKPLVTTGANIVGMVVTVGTGIPLALAIGITGPAFAALLGQIAFVAVMLPYVARELVAPLRRLWPLRCLVSILAAYGAGFAAARFVDDALPGPPGAAVALAVGAVAYLGALVVTGGLLARDRNRIASGITRLRRSPATAE
jgi:O-antigen/teichoic acid export membrane protein